MAIDLSRLTPEQRERFLHMQGIVGRQEEAAARVRALRAYYDGEHPVLLTDRQTEFLGKSLTDGEFAFSHNAVKSVIDTLRERLSVSGFTVNGAGLDSDGDTTPEMRVAQMLWAWWEENRFDAQQIRQHRRALRDGLAYVMVDHDAENNRPRFTLHHRDDYTTGIVCHRDPENPERIMFMNKYWYTFNTLEPGKTGIARKTTYLPHEIRKYALGKEGQWMPHMDEGDAAWPLPWLDWEGRPLGIPIIEFENPGGSEVAQIIGLQNALNKSWLDLLAAADAAGFPIIAIEYDMKDVGFDATGDDDDIDGDDEFVIAPGRALEVDGARVHRIEGANLAQLIDTVHLLVETIAGISRTPQYYLRPAGGSDVPSGEALKQLESGLVSRAIERQLIFGQAWADVMMMAYRVQRTYGSGALPDIARMRVETVWESAETRQELPDAQRAEILKRLGVPDDEIWEMLGYSPEKVAAWKLTQRSDQAMQVATIAEALRAQPVATNGAQPNGNGATV
jgi:hypothetical protein